jgi:hypothetical protein
MLRTGHCKYKFCLGCFDDENKLMQFDTSDKYEAWVDILTCLTMGFQRHFISFAGFARIPQYFIESEDPEDSVNHGEYNQRRRSSEICV